MVKSGDRIHLHSVACAPQGLIQALCARGRAGELKNIKLQHLHTEGCAPYAEQEFEGVFSLESFFVGHNVRKATQEGWADYIPVHLSETQKLIRMGYTPVDVAMIQVCPPDKHGYVSMGTSVDATLAAVQHAKTVIAVINPDALARVVDLEKYALLGHGHKISDVSGLRTELDDHQSSIDLLNDLVSGDMPGGINRTADFATLAGITIRDGIWSATNRSITA